MEILKMKSCHIDKVYEIEKNTFSISWTKESIRDEVEKNKLAIYLIAEENNEILGYAGMWHVVTEGHITNIAVSEEHRQKGVGSKLLEELIKIAEEKEMIGLTLEVRVGNKSAMNLYGKYGFKIEGYRKNYYSDTKEDAVLMWKYFDESKNT